MSRCGVFACVCVCVCVCLQKSRPFFNPYFSTILSQVAQRTGSLSRGGPAPAGGARWVAYFERNCADEERAG